MSIFGVKFSHILLVFVHFGALFLMAFTGRVMPSSLLVFVLQLCSVLLGVWSVIVMKLHTLSVFPDIKSTAVLCTSGPYRIIRHPMYTALLLLVLALLLNDFSLVRTLIVFLILIDLLLKIKVEERILRAHYPSYDQFVKVSKKIIPYIY